MVDGSGNLLGNQLSPSFFREHTTYSFSTKQVKNEIKYPSSSSSIQNVDNEIDVPFPHSYCVLTYSPPSNIGTPWHQSNIAEDKTQKFQCQFCGRILASRPSYDYHIRKHTGKMRFSCAYCSYQCIQKCDYDKHIKIHTGEKPFSCPHCQYRCIRKTTLLSHLKIHENERFHTSQENTLI